MATPATPAHLHPPSPPLQTPVVDFTLLERQKENIQPLRAGRSAAALQSVFSAPRADRAAVLAQGHAKYRAEMDAVEEAELQDGHDDPLAVYAAYVKWVIDNYPAGQTSESGIVPLIEKATRRFKDDARYKGDLRYLKLWVAYAGYVHDPKLIYQFLLANEIGTHHALLYEEFAGVLERSGSRAQADETFRLGIARKAQPLARLPSRYVDFQKRMLHLPPDANTGPASVASEAPASTRRPALAPRTHAGATPLIPSGPATNPAARSNAGITVFVDPEPECQEDATNEWPDIGTKASRVKENTQEAGQWKGEKMKMRGPVVAGVGATPARRVEVYQDAGEAAAGALKTPSAQASEEVFSRSLKPSEDQLLRQNPFKNYSPTPASTSNNSLAKALMDLAPVPPPMPAQALPVPDAAPSQYASSVAPADEPAHPFVPPFVPEKLRLAPGTSKSGKQERVRIDLGSMYKDGQEWSLDEMRARLKGVFGKKWEEDAPPPAPSVLPAAVVEGLRDLQEPLKDEPAAGAKKVAERDRTMRLDAPTIHTRAALDDVYGLFNTSPAKSEQDEPPSPDTSPLAPPPAALPARFAPIPKQNENATARKVSGSSTQSRAPFTPFTDLPIGPPSVATVLATPTPAQGSLGRSAGAKAARFDLAIAEENPEPDTAGDPEKGRRKPFEIFVEPKTAEPVQVRKPAFEILADTAPAPTPAKPVMDAPKVLKKAFEIFVDPNPAPSAKADAPNVAKPFPDFTDHSTAPTLAKPSEITARSAIKPFEVFVDETPAMALTNAASSDAGSTAVPVKTEKPAFVPFVDPLPAEGTGPQSVSDVPSPLTLSPELPSVPPETLDASTPSTEPKMLSFIDPSDMISTRKEEAPPVPVAKKAVLSFIDSPERHKSASPQTAPPPQAALPNGSSRPQKPLNFTLPPRQQLDELISAAAQLESESSNEDDQQEEPRTPWGGADDEEGWIAEQELQRQAARNARLGNFNIMTPITERTCEFTQMGSVVDAEEKYREDEDEDESKAPADAEDEQERARWEEEVREEDKVVGEFEVPISREDASVLPRAPSEDEDLSSSTSALVAHTESLTITGSPVLIQDIGSAPAAFPPNPCNPFDDAILGFILSHLPSLESNPNFIDMRPGQANKMEGLQKYAKKLAKKSGNTTTAFSDDSFPLQLGKDTFEVKDKLGEGGFGAVFLAALQKPEQDDDDYDILDDEDEDDERFVAIKAERPSNLWESVVLQRIQDALPERLRRSVIRTRSMYAFADESFLVLDFCQQGTLLDTVNRSSMASSGTSNQPGMDELLVMFFSIELIRLVEGLHTAGFIHGDMKIDNCLVRLDDVPGGASAWSSAYNRAGDDGWAQKGIRMIDFGRAIDTRIFPPGQTFIADWPTDQRDCVEMREQRPWTYQSDYFGLASIVYCMLFGKYIETVSTPLDTDSSRRRFKVASQLKRYWQADLWNRLFDVLLNPCLARDDGSLPVTDELAAIRGDMESWLEANCDKAGKSLKGLLKKVELAALDKRRR